jgi:DNA modification methylase
MVPDGYERTNVWHINPETASKHPAPYPVELAEKLVQYYSFVGDTVLDPYMGSGTTAVAAKKLNRSCIGFEIHSEYVDLAMTRVSSVHPPEASRLQIPSLKGEHLRQWLAKKSKRFLLAFLPQKNLKKDQLISAVYEKFSSSS